VSGYVSRDEDSCDSGGEVICTSLESAQVKYEVEHGVECGVKWGVECGVEDGVVYGVFVCAFSLPVKESGIISFWAFAAEEQ